MSLTLELHDELILGGFHALLLVLSDFEPLARLFDLLILTVIENLGLWVNQVDADVHKLLIVVSESSVKAILSVEEVLIALWDLPLMAWVLLHVNDGRNVG